MIANSPRRKKKVTRFFLKTTYDLSDSRSAVLRYRHSESQHQYDCKQSSENAKIITLCSSFLFSISSHSNIVLENHRTGAVSNSSSKENWIKDDATITAVPVLSKRYKFYKLTCLHSVERITKKHLPQYSCALPQIRVVSLFSTSI